MAAPQLQVGKFVDFIQSKEFVVAASALILTPLILRSVESVVAKTPILQQNFTLGLIVAAFVLFAIAGFVPAGMARALVLGLSVGVGITAVAPFFENQLNSVFGGSG